MPDTLKTAVIAALEDQDVHHTITENMQQAVQGTLQTALPAVVKAAVLGTQQAADQKKGDPYRTTIYFLAGLIAFCLAVITGVFNAFPDPPADTGDVVYRMLGGVLAWISITALVATVCMAVVQILKYRHSKDANAQDPATATLALLMGIPTLIGAMAVTYCIRGGMAVLNGGTELVGLLDALCKLVRFCSADLNWAALERPLISRGGTGRIRSPRRWHPMPVRRRPSYPARRPRPHCATTPARRAPRLAWRAAWRSASDTRRVRQPRHAPSWLPARRSRHCPCPAWNAACAHIRRGYSCQCPFASVVFRASARSILSSISPTSAARPLAASFMDCRIACSILSI